MFEEAIAVRLLQEQQKGARARAFKPTACS
jgi:hypothetical protein